MHPADIKAALSKKNVSAAKIADELHVSRTAVSNVIAGRSTSARIANRIATIIGKPVQDIWEPQPTIRRTKEQLRQTA